MAKRYKNITIHPAQGGQLIGSASDDVPITQESNYLSSSANYTKKVNFRRETDGELRREGWEEFNPKSTSEKAVWGNPISFLETESKYPVRLIHQFPGEDGTPVLVAIAGPHLWKMKATNEAYSTESQNVNTDYAEATYLENKGEDFLWEKIYEFKNHMDVQEADGTNLNPTEGGAYRWEVAEVKNHLIINNGIDLPVVYKAGWDAAEPLYGLRENGVISVGTISSYQDRLFCSDLTVITTGYDAWFINANYPYGSFYDDEGDFGDDVLHERFQYRMVHSAEGDPKLFNSGIIDGNSPVMESGGLPAVMTISTESGEKVHRIQTQHKFQIGTPGSMYKLRDRGIERGEEAYVLVIPNQANVTVPTEKLNDDSAGLAAGVGIFLTPDGDNYRLVNSDGNNLVFLNSSGGDFPDGQYVVVLRPYAEQLRNPASFREFPQDGSRILKMEPLADKLVVYRDSGFFFLSRTNRTDAPFSVEPRYHGGRIADFRHTIINIDGKQHIFMGNSGVYSITRSSTEPQPVRTFEYGPPFWQKVPTDLAEFVYAVDNPITREIFIICPTDVVDYKTIWGVIAYDYINGTLSEIDVSFTSCASIRKPKFNRVGPEEPWFLMGVHQASSTDTEYTGTQVRDDDETGATICRYGYGPPPMNAVSPYRVYSRLGKGYQSIIKSGLIDFGDSFSDKEVRSYVLELSSKYGTTPVQVKISTTTAPQGTEEIETMQVVDGVEIDYVELNNLVDENMIPMYVRAPYIRDQITVLPEYDNEGSIVNNPIKIVGRTFEVSGVNTRSTTQAVNQG